MRSGMSEVEGTVTRSVESASKPSERKIRRMALDGGAGS
jgi:hypothetical protein